MPNYIKTMTMRDSSQHERAATQLELFFDLVFVIAIAAVTGAYHHAVSANHGLELLPNFIFTFIAIWWAWMNFTWFASAFDNDDALYRILTISIMAGALIFAGGAESIFKTMRFGVGIIGWLVMRTSMVALWIRAGRANPEVKKTCNRYAIGLIGGQSLWVFLLFIGEWSLWGIVPGSAAFMILGSLCFLVEFSIPVWAESAGHTSIHAGHIMERYGLLNIIVFGEVLFSISLIAQQFFDGHGSLDLAILGVSSLVMVFALWWVYFLDDARIPDYSVATFFTWGYGHVFIFFGAAALGAGIGAELDVLTNHSKLHGHNAIIYIAAPIALYFITLWLIRDRHEKLGLSQYSLLISGLLLIAVATLGVAVWVIALMVVTAVMWRMYGQKTVKDEQYA